MLLLMVYRITGLPIYTRTARASLCPQSKKSIPKGYAVFDLYMYLVCAIQSLDMVEMVCFDFALSYLQ